MQLWSLARAGDCEQLKCLVKEGKEKCSSHNHNTSTTLDSSSTSLSSLNASGDKSAANVLLKLSSRLHLMRENSKKEAAGTPPTTIPIS